MIQGSLCDARDIVSRMALPAEEPLAPIVAHLLRFIHSLTGELVSKELALARVQSALWELDATKDQLRAGEARFRTTLESIGDAVISADALGRVEFMNAVAAQLTGWDPAEAFGRPITEVFPIVNAQTREPAENSTDRVLREGAVVGLANHTVLLARDGTERQIADSCAPIHDEDRRVIGAVLVFRDVTEEYHRREQMRESEARYRAVFEGAGEGIMVADIETRRFLFCNTLWCSMFGYSQEDVPNLRVVDLHPVESLSLVAQTFDAQVVGDQELALDVPCLRRDGSQFIASVRARPVQFAGRRCTIGFFSDASERLAYATRLKSERARRQQAEIELRHAQKLEAVGQLAAGIAHEINTPTQFVGDSIHFLADSFEDSSVLTAEYRRALSSVASLPGCEEIARRVAEAEEAADIAFIEENVPSAFQRALEGIGRIATIVNAMKEFAHPDRREKSPADLNRALQATLTIARNEYKYVADAVTEFADLPPVVCHAGDLNQVFLNLLVNAAHAIADAVGKSEARGRITVRTSSEDGYARIDVSDTGCGVPEKIRDRIFEPFFTTKEVGRGSGQGLAIARAIVVDRHGGTLDFESEVGKGTTFTIRLPFEGSPPPAGTLPPEVVEL